MAGFKRADRKKVLRAIKELRSENLKYNELADRLNSLGYARPNGTAWNYDSIASFCHNHGVNKQRTRRYVKREVVAVAPQSKLDLVSVLIESNIDSAKKTALIAELFK